MNHMHSEDQRPESGIKVLDRAVSILFSIADKPQNLAELTKSTGLPRATAHRLASALETHDLLSRTPEGMWAPGSALPRLFSGDNTSLIDVASPIMAQLVELTGESVQLYQREGDIRKCVAAQEPPSGLQNTVPVGSRLPLTSGSAARVFAAFDAGLNNAHSSSEPSPFPPTDLQTARDQGWAESIAEREPGLASISAPIHSVEGHLLAVLSISGPAERLGPEPGNKWGEILVGAADNLQIQIAHKL